MLMIRLARVGRTKKPVYRIMVSEKGRDAYGKYLEVLGRYQPTTKVCEVDKDRILHWISVGAKLSPTLYNLMIDQNVITGKKVSVVRRKKIDAEESKTAAPASDTEAPKENENEPIAQKEPVAAVEKAAEEKKEAAK